MIKDNKFLKFPKTKERLNIGKLGIICGKVKTSSRDSKVQRVYSRIGYGCSCGTNKNMYDNGRYMGIDLGIDNLATIVLNTGR